MKSTIPALLLILTIGTLGAADLESYQFIDCLRSMNGPGAPVIYEDSVIFTASSSYRRVGISFAHEGYSKVHWYKKLMLPEDPAVIAAAGKKKNVDPYRDSGMLFHVELIPEGMRNMDYRVIIDGLWTADPLNLSVSTDGAGLSCSRVIIPEKPLIPSMNNAPAGTMLLSFRAPPGETITAGGSFNGWDPFMYELKETSPGFYILSLALPPGTYQYVLFYRGERFLDPNNPRTIYTKSGKAASEAVVR